MGARSPVGIDKRMVRAGVERHPGARQIDIRQHGGRVELEARELGLGDRGVEGAVDEEPDVGGGDGVDAAGQHLRRPRTEDGRVEADVDEVLQVAQVFSNTVHGVVAPKKQLQKHFPGLSIEQICEEILKKGSLQVSAKEREAETDKLMAEVTNLVASMCIDAATGARLAPDAVGRLLRDDAGFAPSTTKSAKRQALDVMKVLERDHGLKRAPMELRVVCGAAEPLKVVAALQAVDEEIKSTVKDASITCLVPPRVYRDIVEAVAKATDQKGSVEVVERAAVCEASTTLPPPPPVIQEVDDDDFGA